MEYRLTNMLHRTTEKRPLLVVKQNWCRIPMHIPVTAGKHRTGMSFPIIQQHLPESPPDSMLWMIPI